MLSKHSQLKNDTGSGSVADLLRMDQSISALDVELHEAEFALASIRLELADVVGLSQTDFDLQELRYTDDASELLADQPIDSYTRDSAGQALEIRDLYLQLKLAEYDMVIESDARLPDFYLEYQYEQTDVPGQEDERSVSINMSWNLFDGWAGRYGRLGSLTRYRLAQRQYNEGLLRFERRITGIKREIIAGIRLYGANSSSLDDSEEIISMMEMGASYGSRNVLDVLQATNDYFDARQSQFVLFAQILRNLNELWKISNNLNLANSQLLSEVLHDG